MVERTAVLYIHSFTSMVAKTASLPHLHTTVLSGFVSAGVLANAFALEVHLPLRYPQPSQTGSQEMSPIAGSRMLVYKDNVKRGTVSLLQGRTGFMSRRVCSTFLNLFGHMFDQSLSAPGQNAFSPDLDIRETVGTSCECPQ